MVAIPSQVTTRIHHFVSFCFSWRVVASCATISVHTVRNNSIENTIATCDCCQRTRWIDLLLAWRGTLEREIIRRATTALIVTAAAAAGGTAVRCCRVHVCSYTRGLTYARLAAYRPRRARSRPRIGVNRGGGVVRSPGRKRKGRAGARQGESIDASTAKRRKRNKESRAWCQKLGGTGTDTEPARLSQVGSSRRVGGERRLQSQGNAAPPGEAKASSPIAGTRASESAPFSSRVHLGRLLSAKSKREREKERAGKFAYAMLASNRRATCPTLQKWRRLDLDT